MKIRKLNENLKKVLYEKSDDRTKARELLQRVYKILWDNGFKHMNTYGKNESEGIIAYSDAPFPYDYTCTDYTIANYKHTDDYFCIHTNSDYCTFGYGFFAITTPYGELFNDENEINLDEENKKWGIKPKKEDLCNTDVIVYGRTDEYDWRVSFVSFDFIKQEDTDEQIKDKLDNVFRDVEEDYKYEIHFKP